MSRSTDQEEITLRHRQQPQAVVEESKPEESFTEFRSSFKNAKSTSKTLKEQSSPPVNLKFLQDQSSPEVKLKSPEQPKHPSYPALPHDLVTLMTSAPQNSNPIVISKWKELGPLDLNQLIANLPEHTSRQRYDQSGGIDNLWGLIDLDQPTKITGLGRHIFPSGNVYEGMYKSDKRDGYGRLIWSDGAYYVGEWKKDKRSGKGTFTHANGDREAGNWKNGKISEEAGIEYQCVVQAQPPKEAGSSEEYSVRPDSIQEVRAETAPDAGQTPLTLQNHQRIHHKSEQIHAIDQEGDSLE